MDIERLGLKEDEDFEKLLKFKKTDAQIKIIITIGKIVKVENLSLKKANSDADFNQVVKGGLTLIRKYGDLIMK
ncbi:MAG: hypothetical protein ACOYU0_05830 [Nitrospirota bacterium]